MNAPMATSGRTNQRSAITGLVGSRQTDSAQDDFKARFPAVILDDTLPSRRRDALSLVGVGEVVREFALHLVKVRPTLDLFAFLVVQRQLRVPLYQVHDPTRWHFEVAQSTGD